MSNRHANGRKRIITRVYYRKKRGFVYQVGTRVMGTGCRTELEKLVQNGVRISDRDYLRLQSGVLR